MSTPFHLRHYRDEDEDAAIALWQQSWQRAYPSIDFAAYLRSERVKWTHVIELSGTRVE